MVLLQRARSAKVWRLEFNENKVNQRMLDLLGNCGRLQHLVFNQCTLLAGRLPALPQLAGLVINPSRYAHRHGTGARILKRT